MKLRGVPFDLIRFNQRFPKAGARGQSQRVKRVLGDFFSKELALRLYPAASSPEGKILFFHLVPDSGTARRGYTAKAISSLPREG